MKPQTSIDSATIIILTEDDVLSELRAVLKHGYGHVEIIVTDGYIRTIHQNRTRQGHKPLPPTNL